MKRRLLTLTMLIALAMTTLLAACGATNDVPANAIVDTPAPTSTPEPTPTPTSSPEVDNSEDGIVSSGTLDEIPDANEDGNEKFSLGDYDSIGTRTVYTMLFPDNVKAEAWLQEHHFENPDYSYYITYFKNGTSSADEMSFTWVGPVGIGDAYRLSGDEMFFCVASDNQRLLMWNYGKMTNEDELMKNTSVDTIIGWASGTPIEDSFQYEETDEFYRVTFMTNEVIDGKNYTGYDCYIDFYDIMECWQFSYLVKETDDFNETEALAVVNSIVRVNLDDLGIIVEE